ncbi:hypothetical protein EAX61_03790 [Dokdonia sinensis]|uniref:NlpE C-terminal OB domain-containing protein n=1 Tax=Dokdonia sinensis TaxID=2479847 RepID=A0A3M0GGW9_9FLAO|nr:hypothetical protein [Dokdonia sinensis]RMB63518.1 hypothetical protein EAX61_03790 [Dokdonia sinensis]
MKKIILLFAVLVAFTSCKEDTKNEDTTTVTKESPKDDYKLLRGEFIYLADAAVLNCGSKIYGVVIDDKMQELANQVAKKKKEDFDMVPVVIRGEVMPNPALKAGGEGWPEVVAIKEILKVMEPSPEGAVKIESGKNSGK